VEDTGSKNADVESVPHFALLVAMEFLPQETGNILRSNGVNMEFIDVELLGELIRFVKISDIQKGIVLHLESDPFPLEL
jgi:hypothetical protein